MLAGCLISASGFFTILMRFFLFICLLLFASFFNEAFAEPASDKEIQVWNPEKVDWWVAIDDSIMSGTETCEMHWLYDDGLDLFLTLNRTDRLVFVFKITPKNSKPPLTLRKGMAQAASLSVNDVKHKLGVADIDLPPLLVFMGMPATISHLEYLEGGQRILLNLDNVVYNFPLENIKENMTYFRDCMKSLGREINTGEVQIPGADPEWQPQAASSHPQMPVTIPQQDAAVTAEPLPAPGWPQPAESDALLPLDEASPPEEESKVMVASLNKGSPEMAQDLHIEGITPEKSKAGNRAAAAIGGESCGPSDDPYDEQGTAVIHNLTRKLQILENEKEELRQKLLSVSGEGMLANIMKCDSQPDEFTDDPVNENVIAEFESIVGNLRAENELLKEALEDAETNSGKGAEELAELRTRTDELLKDNQQLQDKLFQYQLDFKKAEEEKAEKGSDDTFEAMMETNGLVEDGPPKPAGIDEPATEKQENQAETPESPADAAEQPSESSPEDESVPEESADPEQPEE